MHLPTLLVSAFTHSLNGKFEFDPAPGCTDPDVPGVWSLCMNYGAKPPRAHFHAVNEPKHRFKEWKEQNIGSCYGETCGIARWTETV
ncbi:hypothetical protein B0T16DRAFT_460705 [Cercophora newfieldiana]|uniref:Uncharacterized protein n=1 Tax=Cercophora newfieldiana TaxID=92897 RepID=A0AA40CN89_9PEZI|nr:hypothetical protein B0T16DRAFT_460705 [Cercophora newfieldiana]